MNASYSTLLTTDKDKVRLHIGDTDMQNPKFSDDEIDSLLSTYPSPLKVSCILVQSIIAKYAFLVSQSVGEVSVSYGELRDNYKNLLSELQKSLAIEGGNITAGGISKTVKELDKDNEDRLKPAFEREDQG